MLTRLGLALFLGVLTGCSQGGGGSMTMPDMSGYSYCNARKKPPACCNPDGSPVQPVSGACADVSQASVPQVTGALTSAATAAASASDSHYSALAMKGPGTKNQTGGANFAQNAIRGGILVNPTSKSAKDPLNDPNKKQAPAGAGLLGSSPESKGSANTQGASYSGALANGQTQAAAAPDGTSDGAMNLVNPEAISLPKLSFKGLKGSAADGSGGSGENTVVQLNASNGGESQGSSEHDANGSLTPVDPMGGASDPEDYFTRLDLKDSLFKVVERRYTKTIIRWASVDFSKTKQPTRLK